MKVRFLSSVPCALTVGGKYYGVTDGFERFAEITLKDNLFACFSPQNALPLGVFLNENLFFAPPEGVYVCLLRDGAAVYARSFPPRLSETRIVAQERFVADLITVFFQGTLCISLETSAGFYISPLPLRYENATISKHGELYFVEGKNALCIFNARGKKLFDEEVLSYTADEATLKASVKLSGGAKRVLYGEWALAQNECYRISGKIEGTENSGLIAYDFFENFRVGADVSAFLSHELTEKSEKLGAYLGEYAYAFPCENENECGVLRKKGERIYEADYYVTETSGGKITDFKKI